VGCGQDKNIGIWGLYDVYRGRRLSNSIGSIQDHSCICFLVISLENTDLFSWPSSCDAYCSLSDDFPSLNKVTYLLTMYPPLMIMRFPCVSLSCPILHSVRKSHKLILFLAFWMYFAHCLGTGVLGPVILT